MGVRGGPRTLEKFLEPHLIPLQESPFMNTKINPSREKTLDHIKMHVKTISILFLFVIKNYPEKEKGG